MRLVWSLHAGWGCDKALPPARILEAVLAEGHRTLNAPSSGRIAAGAPADLVVIDRKALDEDALMEVEPLELLFARASARHLKESLVAGRTVVRDGRPIGIDFDALQAELRAQLRAGIAARDGFRRILPEVEAALAAHFADRAGCC